MGIRIGQLEETYKGHLAQLPDHSRANQKCITESITQMPFEHQPLWGINHLTRKPIPMFKHPDRKGIFPNIQSEPPVVHLCAVPTHPIINDQGEDAGITLSTGAQYFQYYFSTY